MANDRVDRMLARLDLGAMANRTLDSLCVACARELDVTGAGIALIVDGAPQGALGVSDPGARDVEAMQATYAEGPCMDAHLGGEAVLEPALAESDRWAMWTPAAVAAGVRAVFAFPLQLGAARFGAIDLYRTSPGALSQDDIDDAGSLASLVTSLVLVTQAGAPPGSLSEAIDVLVSERSAVHQAAGMASAQLDVSIEDAIVALRAHAFATDRSLDEVAGDVATRVLRLEP